MLNESPCSCLLVLAWEFLKGRSNILGHGVYKYPFSFSLDTVEWSLQTIWSNFQSWEECFCILVALLPLNAWYCQTFKCCQTDGSGIVTHCFKFFFFWLVRLSSFLFVYCSFRFLCGIVYSFFWPVMLLWCLSFFLSSYWSSSCILNAYPWLTCIYWNKTYPRLWFFFLTCLSYYFSIQKCLNISIQ